MAGRLEIAVHVTPRAGRSGIDGVDGEGQLRLRVSAPPVGGAANEAVVALLASELGVRRSRVEVIGGATSRHKRVRVDGVEAGALLTRWPGLRLGGRASD